MKIHPLKAFIVPFTFALTVLGSALLLVNSADAASVGPTGYTNSFSTPPVAADWVTISRSGTASDTYDMDADVNAFFSLRNATNPPVLNTIDPPSANPQATWSSAGQYLQTRPIVNRYTGLIGKFVNNSGLDAAQISLSYLLTVTGTASAEDAGKGTRVFYSLTGQTNSWLSIASLDTLFSAPAVQTPSATLSLSWASGASLYFLWVDDNNAIGTDLANQIDNLSLQVTTGTTPLLAGSVTAPTNNLVLLSGSPVVAAANAIFGSAPYKIEYFLSNGSGSSPFSSVGISESVPYNVNLGNLAAGTYNIFAVVTDSAATPVTAITGTNTFFIADPISVTVTAPTVGTVFDLTANISGTAAIFGGTAPFSTLFFLDSVSNGPAVTTSPFVHSFGTLAPGDHSIKVRVTDSKGWVSNSLPVFFHVKGPLALTLSPTNGATSNFGQPVALSAETADGTPPFSITFFTNSQPVGISTSAPFGINAGVLPVGTYNIYALATDNSVPVQQAYSTTNLITVVSNPLIMALSSPTNGQTAATGQPFTLSARPSVGAPLTITNVQFFFDGASAGVDSSAPYSISVASPAEGVHTAFAVATDSLGRVSYSTTNVVTFIVDPLANDNFDNRAELSTPARVTGLTTGATTESGEPTGTFFPRWGATLWWKWTAPVSGTVIIDTFGSGFNTILTVFTGTSVNALTQVAQNDNAPGQIVSRVTFTATQGTEYEIQVGGTQAFGGGGFQPPATGNLQLNLTMPPQVTITSPASNAVFTVGSNITVAATASSAAGSVVKIDFYRKGTFLGSATSAPFSIIYSNAPAGTNSLYAVVTDSVSQVATSAVMNVAFFNTGLTLVSPADGDIFLTTKPLTISALGMLPAGAITHVDFFVDGVKIGLSDLSPFSLVWSNVTGGSHRLTAVGTSDGGQSFASQPVAIGVAKTLVSKGSVWNYLDDGSDQGTNWYLPTFSDNTWASGPAELGYGDGDEVTVVNGGPTTSRLITTYFRRAFVASNLSAYASFVLNVKRDDGAVVYLNGVEAARFNMNQGPVNYLTLALNADDDGTNFWPAAVLPKLFLEGTNLLAVEIHQTAANSSDISFDLELLGIPAIIRNLSPAVTITNLVDDSSFVGLTSLLMEATASDRDGNVTNVAFYADGLKLAEAAASPYNFTWVNPPVGAHVLTAVATDDQGATTTSTGIRVKLYDVVGNPLAQILSPANGTVVEGPTNMLVTASVSALDSVTHVQFFADGGSIGDVAAAPYEVVWTAPFGNSILTAVAYGANGKTGTSTGVSVTITIPPTNTVAPTIAAEYPPAGSIVSSLTNVLVTFSERVQGVDASDLMINGIPAAAVTGSGSNYNFTFPQPPYGEVDVSWAVGHGITDFGWPANLPFYELSAEGRWEYELVDRNPPSVIARTPAQGTLITNLTQITVTFSEPVAGVDASDLLVAGVPATDVSSNGNQYIFSVVQPPSGTVNITWSSTNGITDLAVSGPNPFNGSSANARWSFTLDTRTIFVQTNSAWKFIKGLAEASTPTNAWRQQGFDDSSWSNAFAPFFYGDPYSNGVSAYTLLSDMRSNYTSIYLRKEFIIPNVTALTNLLLAAQSDDGFVAWVNGVEVARYNVPAGELSYTSVASSPSPEPQNNGAGYIVYNLTNIAPFLVSGVNTLAVHAFNESLTASSDFGFNAQLYSFLSDAAFAPPRLFQASPTPGDVLYLTNITVKFSEPVSGVDASDLLINGVPATSLSSDGGASYTFGFAQPAYGPVVVSWVTAPGIVDFDQVPKPFNGAATGSILRYTLLNPSAPTVVNSSPAAGLTLISLTDVTVTFSEPVSGVKASDLLINGRQANSVVFNTAATYTFSFAQPAYGKVNIRWATNNGIQDLETPANAFDPLRLSSQWSYNLIDPVPTVALTSPAINSFFLVGSDITVRATATDNDGTISLVELFENGNKLSDSPTAPYTYTWSGAALGAHTLRALATDNSGLRATSAPVVITVVTSLPATLLRGPYLQVGAPNGGVIRWRTDLLSDSVVSFGTDPAALNQSVVLPNQTNEHIVAVSGLLPDTKYFYSIGSSSQTLGSGANYWFVTPPVPGTRKHTRFWALGDSGTANASARAVRDAYYAYAATNGPADFWLMLGDNAYNSGLDTEYQRAVFEMYPDTLRNMFLWPTIGNHESSQAFTAADYPYLHIFTLPQNAEAGGVPSGSPRYYSFDYANIHFVSLDSMTSGRTTNTAMAQWLVSDLAATAQDWIIVFFHHPPYTKGSHNSDAETELIEIRQNILPILEANGVDLVLSGHSHVFERSYLLNGHYGLSSTLTPGMKLDGGDGREGGTGPYQKNISGQGVVYTVAGSSGQVGGGSLNHPAHFISLNELGSLVIDVSSNKLHAEFLASTGVARDSFDLLKRNFAPIADDATIALNEDTQTPVTLKASGNNLTYTVVSAPSHGVATYINPVTSLPVVIGNGTVLGGITSLLYTPASNFFGADSLTFKAADGSLESALGTINLVVQSVNDAPVADASATPMRTLVSANNLNAPAVLDGSRSYDVDHDPLQYYWREGASLLANTMVSIVTLPVGPHNISLVVNDGELSGTDSLLVEVLTPGQSVQRLMMVVNNGASVPKPLLASLEAARAAFDRGNFNAAFNELHAFQNKVSAQVLSKNPTLGNQLIALAQSLMDAISGPNTKPKLVMGFDHGTGHQKVKFSGNAAKIYVIEASTDLVHWQQVGTANHKGNGDFEFDAGAANGAGARFYRVVAPE